MRKMIWYILLVLAPAARAQEDSSPLKGKGLGTVTRYAGGVDKEKVMDLFQDQHYDEALGYLSPVLQADSNNLPVLTYVGYAYYMNDNAAAAITCYRRMLEVDSSSVVGLHFLVTLLENSDVTEALGYAMRLVQLQPNKAAWWRSAGELLGRNKMADSAMGYLWRAYSLAPVDARNVAALGYQLIEARQFRTADSILDLGLARDSLNVNLLKLRVQSAYSGKNYYAVFGPGEQLLRMQEPSVNSLEWLALSYFNMKLYKDCIRVCEGMQDMGFDIEAVYYYESRAQAKLQNYPVSDSLLRMALSKAISKTAEWYYDDLGDNYESQREYRKAVAHYDTAYYLFKDPLALYTCGRICESELHDAVRARGYYQRYLAAARPVTDEEKKVWRYVRRKLGGGRPVRSF